MTMHVKDRLERLSDEAPSELAAPADLWRRGRRRQARQWLAGLGALVVVAVLGGVVVDPLLAPGRVEVATTSGGALRLPDAIREPGSWEPAFDGPPGPLVAVGLGTRASLFTSRTQWWGVSGTSGDIRFLDLPDAVAGSDAAPALSADGRLLAYWFTGPTTEEPILQGGATDPAVGVAVLDLVTGVVQRWDTHTPHGLSTSGLLWAGDVLWWVGGDYRTGGTDEERGGESSARVEAHSWDPTSGERRTQQGVGASMYASGSAPSGALVPGRRGSLRLLVGDEVARRISVDQDLLLQQSTAPALSTSGLLAGVLHEDPSVYDDALHPVVVGQVEDAADPVRLSAVGDVTAWAVLGWRGPSEVVVETTTTGQGPQPVRADVVDVTSGDSEPLVEFRGNVPQTFAAQAWSAEVVEAPEPPFAPDRRVVGLSVAVALLVLVRVVLAVRRRRERS